MSPYISGVEAENAPTFFCFGRCAAGDTAAEHAERDGGQRGGGSDGQPAGGEDDAGAPGIDGIIKAQPGAPGFIGTIESNEPSQTTGNL